MIHRTDVIKAIQEHYNYQKYLEIGIKGGTTFNIINCDFKVGLDIRGVCNPTYVNENEKQGGMSSDDYFADSRYKHENFDLIFIDGDHTKEQVEKDIDNSLNRLLPNGTIVVHDTNPPSEKWFSPSMCGDGWEAFAKLRSTREDLNMFCVPDNFGIGVIQRGSQEIWKGELGSGWNFFNENKDDLMNMVSFESMKERLI